MSLNSSGRVPLFAGFVFHITITLIALVAVVVVLQQINRNVVQDAVNDHLQSSMSVLRNHLLPPLDSKERVAQQLAVHFNTTNTFCGDDSPPDWREVMEIFLPVMYSSDDVLVYVVQQYRRTITLDGRENSTDHAAYRWGACGCTEPLKKDPRGYCFFQPPYGKEFHLVPSFMDRTQPLSVIAKFPDPNGNIGEDGELTWDDGDGEWGRASVAWDPHRNREWGSITFTLPVRFDADGFVTNLVRVSLDMEWMEVALQEIVVDIDNDMQDEHITIIDGRTDRLVATTYDTEIIVRSENSTEPRMLLSAEATHPQLSAAVTRARRHLPDGESWSSLDDHPIIIIGSPSLAFGRISDSGLFLVAVITSPTDVFFEKVNRARTVAIVILVIVTLALTFGATVLVWRWVSIPLRCMREDMQLSARMMLDVQTLSERPESSIREVAQLQRAFVLMNFQLVQARPFLPESVLVEFRNRADGLTTGGIEDEDEDDVQIPDRADVKDIDLRDSPSEVSSGNKRSFTSLSVSGQNIIENGRKSVVILNPTLLRRRFSLTMMDGQRFQRRVQRGDVRFVLNFLQSLVETVCTQVHHYNGVVETFSGDHFLASFNASVTNSSHSLDSAFAAVAIRIAVKERLRMNMRGSAVTGDGFIGNAGAANMLRYTFLSHHYGLGVAMLQHARYLQVSVVTHSEVPYLTRMLANVSYMKLNKRYVLFEMVSSKPCGGDEWMYELAAAENPNLSSWNMWAMAIVTGDYETAEQHRVAAEAFDSTSRAYRLLVKAREEKEYKVRELSQVEHAVAVALTADAPNLATPLSAMEQSQLSCASDSSDG